METFLQYVAPVLVTALFGFLTFALKLLSDKWAAEGKTSKLAAIGGKIAHFCQLVVADLDANLKPQLASYMSDGKITAEERSTLRELALTRVKLLLAKEGLEELSGILGIAASQVDVYLMGAIEKAVAERKSHP